MRVSGLLVLKCDCGHKQNIEIEKETFLYVCSSCNRKYVLTMDVTEVDIPHGKKMLVLVDIKEVSKELK